MSDNSNYGEYFWFLDVKIPIYDGRNTNLYPNVDKSSRIANYFKSESWGRNLQNIILISTPANMIYTIINLVITFNLLQLDVCMHIWGWGRGWRWVGCPCKWGSQWLARSILIGAALQPLLQPPASSRERGHQILGYYWKCNTQASK